MPKGLSKKEKEFLRKFKVNIKRRLPGQVSDIILYGSKARGDASKNSDVDVMVILKNDTVDNIDKVYDVIARLGLKYDLYHISVKIWSKKEFNKFSNIPTLFMRSVMRDAINI